MCILEWCNYNKHMYMHMLLVHLLAMCYSTNITTLRCIFLSLVLAPGGSDYRQRYNDDRSERYQRSPSPPSHPNPTLDKLCATPGCSNLHEKVNGQKYCDECLQALLQSSGQNVPKEQQCKEPTCRRKKAPQRMGYCEKCYEDRYLMGGDYH